MIHSSRFGRARKKTTAGALTFSVIASISLSSAAIAVPDPEITNPSITVETERGEDLSPPNRLGNGQQSGSLQETGNAPGNGPGTISKPETEEPASGVNPESAVPGTETVPSEEEVKEDPAQVNDDTVSPAEVPNPGILKEDPTTKDLTPGNPESENPTPETPQTQPPEPDGPSDLTKLEHDYMAFDFNTGERIDVPQMAPLVANPGFTTYGNAAVNANTYTIKIVNTPRAEQYRPLLTSIAKELNDTGLARISVASGKFPRTTTPKAHEIYFYTDPTSPCGSEQLAACGNASFPFRAARRDNIAISGRVWILPVTDKYSARNKRAVVAHEIGHALGLAHYSGTHKGSIQLMHPTSFAVNTFQAGDRAGLRHLARNFEPKASFTSLTIPRKGKMQIKGWAYDPDTVSSARIRITVDGKKAIERTTNVDNPQVSKAHGLSRSATPGFDFELPMKESGHVVCLSVLNFPRDNYVQHGCKTITSKGVTLSSNRLSGADRYASAVEVSKAAFPSPVKTVFVASGLDFPDALSAGPAASNLGGPLLLTAPASLPSLVSREIKRLKPSHIVIVGGTNSVSSSVGKELKSLAKRTTRIGGTDRYDTSLKIANFAFKRASNAYVATGVNYADALTAGAAAATHGAPLILLDGHARGIDAATVNRLKALKASSVTVIGGSASVHPAVFSALKKKVPKTNRLSGSDRYLGAIALSKNTYSETDRAFVVTGLQFPEGLVSAPLAAKTKSPVFLSNGKCLEKGVLDEISRLGVTRLTLLGGSAVLDASVEQFKRC